MEVDEALSQKGTTATKTFNLKVYSPFKVFFEAPARSVSAVNAAGPFDILPKHHNLITLLSPGDLSVVQADGTARRVRIGGGIMHVRAEQTVVFLDI